MISRLASLFALGYIVAHIIIGLEKENFHLFAFQWKSVFFGTANFTAFLSIRQLLCCYRSYCRGVA